MNRSIYINTNTRTHCKATQFEICVVEFYILEQKKAPKSCNKPDCFVEPPAFKFNPQNVDSVSRPPETKQKISNENLYILYSV